MTARASDRLLGLILIAVAILWCWGVVETIPGLEDGSRLGARGFPLGLGVLLGMLGAIVLACTFVARQSEETAAAGGGRVAFGTEAWAALSTVALLTGYALLLEYSGFVIATALVVAVAIGPVLGIWRARLIILTSLGLSIGIYLLFGKLLGVYLPYGKLINLGF